MVFSYLTSELELDPTAHRAFLANKYVNQIQARRTPGTRAPESALRGDVKRGPG